MGTADKVSREVSCFTAVLFDTQALISQTAKHRPSKIHKWFSAKPNS